MTTTTITTTQQFRKQFCQTAFTLLELLLAISLLSIISTFIFGWLVHSNRQITQEQKVLAEQQVFLRAVAIIRSDLQMRIRSDDTGIQFENDDQQQTVHLARCHNKHEDVSTISYILSNDGTLSRQVDQSEQRFMCRLPQLQFEDIDGVLYLRYAHAAETTTTAAENNATEHNNNDNEFDNASNNDFTDALTDDILRLRVSP